MSIVSSPPLPIYVTTCKIRIGFILFPSFRTLHMSYASDNNKIINNYDENIKGESSEISIQNNE